MFRTDVTTASSVLPTPAAPGTPGFFTNGNPTLGIPATVVDQDFLNRMQEEVMSVLQAAGISPVKSSYSQLLRAIQACSVLNDVGVVNNLVANPMPVFTSLVIGTQLVLIPAFTNTSTANLNVSSGGALAVLRPDGTTLQAGDLPANRRIPIIYDGAAWRLLNWPVRIRIGQPLTLFCNAQTGNDNNNGLTLGTAFQSLQAVYNYLSLNVDATTQTVTTQCSGNFTVGLNATTVIAGATPASIIFNFAAGSTVNVTNGVCFTASNPGVGFTVSGQGTFTASGNSPGTNLGCAFYASGDASINNSGNTFGACGFAHFAAISGGVINANTYTISGSAPNHTYCNGGIENITGTITLTGTPAFSTAFASSNFCGQSYFYAASFSGSATGVKYAATMNGVVVTNTANVSFLPGGSSGTLATGGQYN
jgi:hypothetical protein